MVIGNPLTLGGGGGGFAVTVRHCGANATVTARHGTKQETTRADADGVAVFEKLDKGAWIFASPTQENAVAEIFGKTDLDFEAEVFNPTPNGLIICTTSIGSTVTASNGTTTFKAEKTLMSDTEIHVISIKPEHFSENPITVTCIKADGTSTTQEAVVDGKKDVELNFAQIWLFKEGKGNVGGMTYKHASDYSTVLTFGNDKINVVRRDTNSGECQIYSENQIDLSKSKTIYFEVAIKDISVYQGNTTRCYVCSTEPSNSQPGTIITAVVVSNSTDRVTYTLDCSAITTGYVGIGGSFQGDIFNIWLE